MGTGLGPGVQAWPGPPLLPDTCWPLGRRWTLRRLLLSALEVPDLHTCDPRTLRAEVPTPTHSLCYVATKGNSASFGDQPCRRCAWEVICAYHTARPPARALPVSGGCGAPRGGSPGVGGRRYTTCTRPCSASLAASPFSRGSMKNSSSCIRIRPACRQGGNGSEARSTTDLGGR